MLIMDFKRLQLKFHTGKGQEELVEEVEGAFFLCLFKRPLSQATSKISTFKLNQHSGKKEVANKVQTTSVATHPPAVAANPFTAESSTGLPISDKTL